MPLKAINYDKTHFYKIVCKDLDIKDCYVGHTTDFATRKDCHAQTCTNTKMRAHGTPIYRFIRKNGGWDNWEMVLIKTGKCENALEARSKEREYKEQLNATLNGNVPSRTREQYRIDTKEEKKETDQKYYENNKDTICKRQMQYRKDNPEKVKELDKQAYQRKKATRQRPYECECGCI